MADEVIAVEEAAVPEVTGETVADPASAEGEASEHEAGEAENNKGKGGFQRKIDKLTREKYEREREAAFWREKALAAETAKPKVEEKPKPEGKPSVDDFPDDYTAYIEAVAEWKYEQKAKETEQKTRQTETQKQAEAARAAFNAREATFRASEPEYDAIIAEATDTPMSPALWQEVQDHEAGPALLLYLARNPEQADRLSKLNPTAVAREVGRMESKFMPKAGEEKAAEPQITKAPKPPTPVTGKSATSTKDPAEMDMAEYRAWREKNDPRFNKA